jgi:hypothetical protein
MTVPFRSQGIEARERLIGNKLVTLLERTTELQRLLDSGSINQRLFLAAERYQGLVRRYRAVLEAPSPNSPVASPGGRRGHDRLDWDAMSIEQQDAMIKDRREAQDSYDKVFLLLIDPIQIKRAVDCVCLLDEPADPEAVKIGLRRLAKHWGIEA